MVFGICRLIDILVPDVPESLEIKIKRERYLAKQALADTETIMKVRSVCLIVAYVTVCSHTALTTAFDAVALFRVVFRNVFEN